MSVQTTFPEPPVPSVTESTEARRRERGEQGTVRGAPLCERTGVGIGRHSLFQAVPGSTSRARPEWEWVGSAALTALGTEPPRVGGERARAVCVVGGVLLVRKVLGGVVAPGPAVACAVEAGLVGVTQRDLAHRGILHARVGHEAPRWCALLLRPRAIVGRVRVEGIW